MTNIPPLSPKSEKNELSVRQAKGDDGRSPVKRPRKDSTQETGTQPKPEFKRAKTGLEGTSTPQRPLSAQRSQTTPIGGAKIPAQFRKINGSAAPQEKETNIDSIASTIVSILRSMKDKSILLTTDKEGTILSSTFLKKIHIDFFKKGELPKVSDKLFKIGLNMLEAKVQLIKALGKNGYNSHPVLIVSDAPYTPSDHVFFKRLVDEKKIPFKIVIKDKMIDFSDLDKKVTKDNFEDYEVVMKKLYNLDSKDELSEKQKELKKSLEDSMQDVKLDDKDAVYFITDDKPNPKNLPKLLEEQKIGKAGDIVSFHDGDSKTDTEFFLGSNGYNLETKIFISGQATTGIYESVKKELESPR